MSSMVMPDFQELVGKLLKGDQNAAWELLQNYSKRLHGLARKNLQSQYRINVEPEDVIQSVYKSFIKRVRVSSDDLVFEDAESLFALLAKITVRKCWRKLGGASKQPIGKGSSHDLEMYGAISERNDAVEESVLQETMDYLLEDFDPAEKEIAKLLIVETTVKEIVEMLDESYYSVRVVRGALRERMERLIRIEARVDGL